MHIHMLYHVYYIGFYHGASFPHVICIYALGLEGSSCQSGPFLMAFFVLSQLAGRLIGTKALSKN